MKNLFISCPLLLSVSLGKDRIRYRNEFAWDAAFKTNRFNLTPFISEEIFYDPTAPNLTGLPVGISHRLTYLYSGNSNLDSVF